MTANLQVEKRLRRLDSLFSVILLVERKRRYPRYKVMLGQQLIADQLGIRELSIWTMAYTAGWLDGRFKLHGQ